MRRVFRPADYPCPSCKLRTLRWALTYMAGGQTQKLRCTSCGSVWTRTEVAAGRAA